MAHHFRTSLVIGHNVLLELSCPVLISAATRGQILR